MDLRVSFQKDFGALDQIIPNHFETRSERTGTLGHEKLDKATTKLPNSCILPARLNPNWRLGLRRVRVISLAFWLWDKTLSELSVMSKLWLSVFS